MLVPIIAAAVLITQSGQQFDLACTGTETGGGFQEKSPESWSQRYRIDLNRMVWCNADCASSQSIARADAGEIVLTDQTIGDGGFERHKINRSDGRIVYSMRLSSGSSSMWSGVEGTCRKDTFTPIPAAAF